MAKGGRVLLDKIFPDHWSFMLGEIALYSFVVLMATGVFLALYFVPSASQVIYHGTYAPLRGQRVSEAFESTVNISFGVRGGLLIRQMHHWAADIFVGSIVVHMARIFFTGAFRKPRELNWIIGILMLILAILEGFIGYSLPDDLISGTGLRIGYSIVESIPFVGSYLATFLWGGQFPGNGSIIPRFFIIHVLIIPLVLIGLLSAHLGLLVRQKHTQFKGEGRTENNVVGSPMFPTFMAKTTGFLFMVAGATALLGAFAQINPIWQFGSLRPVEDLLRRAAGLVHGLARRRPAHHAVLGVRRLRPYHSPRGLPARRHLPGVCSTSGSRIRPSNAGSPATTSCTTCWTGRATGPNARRPAPPCSPSVHALRRQLDRRPGQLLPRVAQRRPVVLPHRHLRRPDHRGSRDLPALQGDAGRPRHRQAQAGGHRHPLRRGRVRDRAHRTPARRRARRSSTPSRCPSTIDIAPLAQRRATSSRESSPTGVRQVTR